MKNLISIIIVCFSCSLVGLAQNKTLADKIAALPEKKEYITRYDKFKDASFISAHVGFRFPKGRGDFITAGFQMEWDGSAIPAKDARYWVTLSPRFSFETWDYSRDHHLIFLIDGNRLDLGDGESNGRDSVTFRLKPDEYAKIANGTKVEAQFGASELEINSKQQGRLKTLADLIGIETPTK